MFRDPCFQFSETKKLNSEGIQDLYDEFVEELKKLVTLEKGGVGFYKMIQLLSIMGLVEPRFFNCCHVALKTAPHHVLKRHFGEANWKKEIANGQNEAELVKEQFQRVHNELAKLNPDQTQSYTKNALCKVERGAKFCGEKSTISFREKHPDFLFVRDMGGGVGQLQNVAGPV